MSPRARYCSRWNWLTAIAFCPVPWMAHLAPLAPAGGAFLPKKLESMATTGVIMRAG